MKKILFSLAFFCTLLFTITAAQSYPVFAAVPSFGVQIVPTDNQEEQKQAYFDLTVDPGAEQAISMLVQNNLRRKNKIQITPVVATTNESGHAFYEPTKQKQDPTLQYAFPTLTEPKRIVTLAPNEMKTITYLIKTPKKAFNGIIMGGLSFKSLTAGSVKSNENHKKYKFANIQYNVAVVLRSSAPNKEAVANLSINDPNLDSYLSEPQLQVKVQNTEPNYVTDMRVITRVYQKYSHQLVFKHQQTDLSMAANSSFEFSIPWGKETVSAGSYQAVYDFKSATQHWQFKRDFKVTAAKASELNRKNPKIKVNYTPWLIAIIGLLLMLIGVSSWVIYYKGQQRGRRHHRRKA